MSSVTGKFILLQQRLRLKSPFSQCAMSERHSTSSGDHRSSVSSAEPPKSEIFFWVRSEVFEYGLLPLSPHSDLSFTSLLAIVRKYRNTHELNAQYLRAINTLYSTHTSSEWVSMRCVYRLQIIIFNLSDALEMLSFLTLLETSVIYWTSSQTFFYSRELLRTRLKPFFANSFTNFEPNRYSEWEIIASEDLLLSPAQTRLYEFRYFQFYAKL